MIEEKIKKQVQEIFLLGNIKKINTAIDELISNYKESEPFIRKIYAANMSSMFENESYEKLLEIYCVSDDNLLEWIQNKRQRDDFLDEDIFKYLSKEKVFEKIKNLNINHSFSDGGLLIPIKKINRNIIKKLNDFGYLEQFVNEASEYQVCEIVSLGVTKNVLDIAKKKISAFEFINLLNNNETYRNFYSGEEILDEVKKIPIEKLQEILKYKFLLNKSLEIAKYISQNCNLDSYSPYGVNDDSNIEIIKNMTRQQQDQFFKSHFYSLKAKVMDYFLDKFDIVDIIKMPYFQEEETTKKVLEKAGNPNAKGLAGDYLKHLCYGVVDKNYILKKLTDYEFDADILYQYIGNLIGVSSEIDNWCTEKIGIEKIAKYIKYNFERVDNERRHEYLKSIKQGIPDDMLLNVFGLFSKEETSEKISFLKKHVENIDKKNLVLFLNRDTSSEELVRFFIDKFGIDYVFSNFNSRYSSVVVDKLILDNLKTICEKPNTFLGLLKHLDEQTIISKLKEYEISTESLLEYVNQGIDLSEPFLIALSKYNPFLCFDESFFSKLYTNEKKMFLENIMDVDDKYIDLLFKIQDDDYILTMIKKKNIEFNKIYTKSVAMPFLKNGTDVYSQLYNLFQNPSIYSKEQVKELLLKINNIEGIERQYLNVVLSPTEKDGEFILECIKDFNIDYAIIRQYYNSLIGLNDNLDKYLQDKYGKFIELEQSVDEIQIMSLIDLTESFKGAENVLIAALAKINDISFIKKQITKFDIEKSILLKLNFSTLIDKDVEIFNVFCDKYGEEFVFDYYNSHGYNQEVLKLLLTKFDFASLNIEREKKYIKFLSQITEEEYVLKNIMQNDFNKDGIIEYISILCDKSSEITECLIGRYGIEFIIDNYFGYDIKTYSNLFNHKVSETFLTSLSEEKYEAYVSAFMLYKNKELFFKIIDENFEQKLKEKTGVDILKYLKLNIDNEDESVINVILEDNNFEDVYGFFKLIYKDDSALGVNRLKRIIEFYKQYPELCKELNKSVILSDEQINNLLFLLNRNSPLEVNNLDQLTIVDKIIDEEINSYIMDENVSAVQLKDIFLKNFVNLSFSELRNIFDNHISIDTLEKILSKYDKDATGIDLENKTYIESFYCLFSFLNETINSTNDVASLKKMLELINTKEKREKISKVYSYASNIMEHIRVVYEIDANKTLTNLSSLPKSLFKRKKYYDLSQSEYGLYAHVTNIENLSGLVNQRFNGFDFICLTPISDQMIKGFYDNNITVLYDKIPQGAYIGSSILNMGSNALIRKNSFDTSGIVERFHQFEFKDSSSKFAFGASDHSETICWRTGLLPAGILVRGDSPSKKEEEARKLLQKLIGKPIPLVKVQRVGEKIENPIKIESKQKPVKENFLRNFIKKIVLPTKVESAPKTIENKSKDISQRNNKTEEQTHKTETEISIHKDKIERYKELKRQLIEIQKTSDNFVQKDSITKIENRRYATGASHDLFFCKINEEEYLLKPGMDRDLSTIEPHRVYANYIGYEIQKLVNPETAVEIKKVKARVFTDGTEVLCAATKIKPSIGNFEYLDKKTYPENNYQSLSETQVSSLCKELIVDYLIFNLDAKGANFITDGNFVYGIDKEQALKYALNSGVSLNYAANASNACQSMYTNVFEAYRDGVQNIPDSVFEEMESIAERISNMDDEEYYQIFEEYVQCQSLCHEEYKNIILARKNALYEEVKNFKTELCERKSK